MKWEHLKGDNKWESFQGIYRNKFKVYCSRFMWGGKRPVFMLYIMGLQNYPAFYYKNVVLNARIGKKILIKQCKRLYKMRLPDNPQGDYIPLAGKANGRTKNTKIVDSWRPKHGKKARRKTR
jgi:hypothetical protein